MTKPNPTFINPINTGTLKFLPTYYYTCQQFTQGCCKTYRLLLKLLMKTWNQTKTISIRSNNSIKKTNELIWHSFSDDCDKSAAGKTSHPTFTVRKNMLLYLFTMHILIVTCYFLAPIGFLKGRIRVNKEAVPTNLRNGFLQSHI